MGAVCSDNQDNLHVEIHFFHISPSPLLLLILHIKAVNSSPVFFFLACIDLLIVLSTERVAGPGSHPHRVWMVSPLAAAWPVSGQ